MPTLQKPLRIINSVEDFGALQTRGTNVLVHDRRSSHLCERNGRWNDTPYWAMQMPTTIVPNHSGIFSVNFLGLLQTFLLDANEMANPALRPEIQLQSR
jgi:hypothetical protein